MRECEVKASFSYFSTKKYVVGNQKSRLNRNIDTNEGQGKF